MAAAENLGIKDVQAVLRVVAETAELWYDSSLQRRYALESLCRVIPASAGLCFTCGDVLWGGQVSCGPLVHVGLTDAQGSSVERYLQQGKPADPVFPKLADAAGPVVVMRRVDLVDDKTWYASEYYRTLRKPMQMDDTIYAKVRVQNRLIALALLRKTGEAPFTERQSQLVDLCLSQMAWPYLPDDSPVDPRLAALQPRLRKVMRHLLDGDGEKQVAAKLGLSKNTVHEYVKMLYAHLGVSSRSELLSQWVGRV